MAAPRKNRPRIIAVAGGKGGVGKSTIALNLALAIGRLGHRAVLVDADLGAANLHTMIGTMSPPIGLAQYIDRKVTLLDEARIPIPGSTVGLIAGMSRPGAADLNHVDKARLLRGIARLSTDCVIVDVGAGTSFDVVDLVAIADIKLFVVTPSLPSLHNAYALLKACVHRVLRKLSRDETEQALIDSALAQEQKARTVPQLLDVLAPLDEALARRITDALARFGVGLVGNLIASEADAGVLGRVSAMIRDHLQVSAPVMTCVWRSQALAGGLKAGTGTMAERTDAAHATFRSLASSVLEPDLLQLRGIQRVAAERTMPLWIERDLDATNPEEGRP